MTVVGCAALVFDSRLPGALMMGNLSNGLKAHAVTLFEAGHCMLAVVTCIGCVA